jgi:hypothetical protein
MDLFLTPRADFEKVAAEVKLPEDPNQWPMEILQELYKQVPYISDFDPSIIMDRVDGERGFGFGHIEVKNKTDAPNSASPEAMHAAGINEARIPIVIREGKLQPLDLLVTSDSKMLPLTESRIRQALFRPQLFDITSKTPGDQSMIGQLYPPHRSNFGYGGAGVAVGAEGMGKTGAELTAAGRDKIKAKNFAIPAKSSDTGAAKYPIENKSHAANALARVDGNGTPAEKAKVYAAVAAKYPELAARSSVPAVKAKVKHASVLAAILPTLNETDYEKFASRFLDDNLRAAYMQNHANTSPALQKLSSYEGWSAQKVAAGLANSIRPTVMQISRVPGGYKVASASHNMWMPKEEIISRGQLVKRAGADTALDVDLKDSITMADGANVDRDLPSTGAMEQVNSFGVWSVRSLDGEDLVGYVFPTLMDLDGQHVPMALFTDGAHSAVQDDIAGSHAEGSVPVQESKPRGHGFFFSEEDGEVVGTIPLTIHMDLTEQGDASLLAETIDGAPVRLVRQANVRIPTRVDEETAVIPMDWRWWSLEGTKAVALVKHAEGADAVKVGSSPAAVVIRAGDTNSFSFFGDAVEKLGSDAKFLTYDGAMFLLGGLGVAPKYAQEKLAQAAYMQEPVECAVGRTITTADECVEDAVSRASDKLASFGNMRKDLVKEAAFIMDPMAVDTVLSLGFINPENIRTFVECLPIIDESQQHMAELLLAARMGLPELSTVALERAIRSTEEVYEGLKTLAFNKE